MTDNESMPGELILASASPRRSELLRQIGVQFTVLPADIDEQVQPGEQPDVYVRRMALEKAAAVMGRYEGSVRCVLAADTSVVIDGRILGKPSDKEAALDMLATLADSTHQVLSAVAVTDGHKTEDVLSVTDVTFGPVSGAQASAYWECGEPADKAGAYGIQGHGAVFVRSLQGSYTGVVGLPLYETANLLRSFGYSIGFDNH